MFIHGCGSTEPSVGEFSGLRLRCPEGTKRYRIRLTDGKSVTCLGACVCLSEVFEHLDEEHDDPMQWGSEDEFEDSVTVVPP